MTFAFLIYVIIFLLGWYFYGKNKPAHVLTCLFAIGCGCFKLFSIEECLVHPFDLMILLTLIITMQEAINHRGYFNCKNDPIGKIILIVLVYSSLVCVGSVLTGQELLLYALKVYRVNLILLLYFYYRRQNWSVMRIFFNQMLIFSVIQGVLFYLQLVDVNILQGGEIEGEGFVRYKGFPLLSVLYVLLAMIDNKMKMWKRILMVFFFGGMLLLSMTRGPILIIIVAYATYILLNRKSENLLYLGAFSLAYFFVVAPVMEMRNNERSSSSEDLHSILKNPLEAHNSFTTRSSTILYRMACVTERFDYMTHNPQYLLFGVGTVHENSPKNHYNVFVTGLNNDKLKFHKETVSSDDITWVNVMMRYGMIGVVLFMLMYIVATRVGLPKVKSSQDVYFIMGALLPLGYFIGSFGTNHFDFAIRILEFLVPLLLIRMYTNRAKVVKNTKV